MPINYAYPASFYNYSMSVPSHPELYYFASLWSVIGPQKSCHFLRQSDAKLTQSATWSVTYSRASKEKLDHISLEHR